MTTQDLSARRAQADQALMTDIRRSEEAVLDSLQLPGKMNTLLDKRAGELFDAASTGSYEEAKAAVGRLGLRSDDLLTLLRDSDESTRLAYCRLMMDPQRLRMETPVIGALSFQNAESQREFAEQFAAEGDRTKSTRCARQVGINEERGHDWQRKLYAQLQDMGPNADYKDFMREMGFKGDVFALALRPYDGAASERLFQHKRETIETMAAHKKTWKREEALESAVGSIKIADARLRNGGAIDDQVADRIYMARQGHPDTPEEYRRAIPERDMSAEMAIADRTVSTVVLNAEQFSTDIGRIERGQSPHTDPYSFLDRAYTNASPEVKARFPLQTNEGVPSTNATAEAGLRILVERYREQGNQNAVDALERLVKWPSTIVSAADRDELFPKASAHAAAPVQPVLPRRQESPPQEPPAQPEQPRQGEPVDPFAPAITMLRHWDRCLHRFLEGNTGLPPEARETAAAYRLTARYSARDLRELEQAAAENPELARLTRVLTKARTFLENRTLTA